MEVVDSDEDLTKDLQPLAYHVSNRKRVIQEAMKVLEKKRLDVMIPPEFKDWSRAKLESSCLNILEELDEETILAILDGRGASGAVTSVEHSLGKPSASGDNESGNDTDEDEPQEKRRYSTASSYDSGDSSKEKKKLKKEKKRKKKKEKRKRRKAEKAAAEEQTTPAASTENHKSLIELLQIEIRAKAITALLQRQGHYVGELPKKIEEDPKKSQQSTE